MSDGVEEYRGKEIVVRFDGRKCIHSRNCVLGRPDVFVPNAPGPWIKPDNAAAETIAAIALSCPSGAIAYERLDGGPQETAPPVNVVRIRENGPLAFHAELAIEGEEPAFRATLCRCGASRRKPYCDGSHAAAQFAATGEPATQESSPLPARGGALAVKPLRNGPLMIGGSLEIVSGTGRTVTRVSEAFLCRCGGSANKPFCDGSHKRIGFEAEGTERPKKPAALQSGDRAPNPQRRIVDPPFPAARAGPAAYSREIGNRQVADWLVSRPPLAGRIA